MSNYEENKGKYAFHPGYYISELSEELELNQAELALRLGVSTKTISYIVNGKSSITREIARKLSMMTGTSVELWTGLQAEYDKKILEMKNSKKEIESHALFGG